MPPKTIRLLISQNKLLLILNLSLSFNPFYKLSFAHAAAESGLLDLLSRGPISLDRIVAELAPESKSREVLQALLRLGIRLRQVRKTRKGYSLKGLSRKLAMQQNDEYLALTQEVVGIHHGIIQRSAEIVKTGRKFAFNDHDGRLIARFSRTLKPFILEAIDKIFPVSGDNHFAFVGYK